MNLERCWLAMLTVLYLGLAATGFTWGLPGASQDQYLFDGPFDWSATDPAQPAHNLSRHNPAVGADVDLNPVDFQNGITPLNENHLAQAEIYRRYRLFTRQPDEMITMMALSGMNPSEMQFDPKLYQYGGLFVYPVGALVRVAGWLGIISVSGDSTYYLKHPDAFARMYWMARGYVAAWGIAGIALMFVIGRRIGGGWAGLLSATFFVLLPVVVCMSHEAKPHLPGAVLMLAAVWFAMRALDRQTYADWAGLFVSCGAAVAMVLSSAPIVILIPLAIGMHSRNQHLRQVNELPACSNRHVDYRPIFLRATAGGLCVAGFVYLITNPYIAINAFVNRPVLASNFGNSMAMYEVSRIPEGFLRVLQLTIEGATIPITMLGIGAAIAALRCRSHKSLPLLVAAGAFALQFVLIGAGKPDEYGRFGIFYECALAIGVACIVVEVARRSRPASIALGGTVAAWCAIFSAGYLWSFHVDATGQGSRDLAAAHLNHQSSFAVIAEPAPYACPPVNFETTRVVMFRNGPDEPIESRLGRWFESHTARDPVSATSPTTMVAIIDDPESLLNRLNRSDEFSATLFENRPNWLPRANISWANKPVLVIEYSPNQKPRRILKELD
ncbi:MAG: glycosyltransferase family 39 protein [Planctomycetes bacterium]|nr:glycosyltransferase family 39 protein [Planctomycetota bacterium]